MDYRSPLPANIDSECNALACRAMALAYRVHTFKPMGQFNDPQRVVDIAETIIALRCRESIRESARAVDSIQRARYGV